MTVDKDFFRGRQLIRGEIPLEHLEDIDCEKIIQVSTMAISPNDVQCLRCGTKHQLKTVRLGQEEPPVYYCPTCILLGRVQSNQFFYYQRAKGDRRRKRITFNWDGELAPSQVAGSQAIQETIREQGELLIHGVTGAGKTEMLFAGLLDALQQGQRVCLASPRVDVCLEIFPRLQKVFPALKMMLLYGEQEQPYAYTSLVVCTTHQLLRFRKAFDVVIIDEIDAFPFSQEKFLAYGLTQARKTKSAAIYLTATPSPELLAKVQEGRLNMLVVPMRYHGQALPVPESVWLWQYYQKVSQGQLPPLLSKLFEKQLADRRLTLIFCPTINIMLQLEKSLRLKYPQVKLASASAQDPLRNEKVLQLRQGDYQLFLTTTILERGVTFSGIDVIILGSNHRVFNQGSLVQISGRVGRSPEEPTGKVYFVHDGWSRAMLFAKRQILRFNELAKETEVSL